MSYFVIGFPTALGAAAPLGGGPAGCGGRAAVVLCLMLEPAAAGKKRGGVPIGGE